MKGSPTRNVEICSNPFAMAHGRCREQPPARTPGRFGADTSLAIPPDLQSISRSQHAALRGEAHSDAVGPCGPSGLWLGSARSLTTRTARADPPLCAATSPAPLPKPRRSPSIRSSSLWCKSVREGSTRPIPCPTLAGMAMGTTRDDGSQQSMWVATADLPQGGGHPFYARRIRAARGRRLLRCRHDGCVS